MSRLNGWTIPVVGLVAIVTSNVATAQNFSQPNFSRPANVPASRMRPIGSASAVDQYRQRTAVTQPAVTQPAMLRETGYRNGLSNPSSQNRQPFFQPGAVRQTAMQFGFPADAGSNVGPPETSPAPPNFNSPGAISNAPLPPGPLPQVQVPSSQTLPQQNLGQQNLRQGNLPATLPFPGPTTAVPIGPRSDYAPMSTPSLGGSISNINNCANVTGPSGYSAAFSSPCGCAPVAYQAPVPQAFQAPPAQIAAPAIVPGGQFSAPSFGAPVMGAPAALNPAPVGSLLSFGQERYPVQVGQGLLGQPKAYVPGQTFRNWLRYFTP